MQEEPEVWKAIEGYPGYEVSTLGRVKSLVKAYRREELILTPSPNTTAYMLVQLYPVPRQRKSLLVHRLVMLTFQPNPMMDELEVNHKDLDVTNNKMSNLEWATSTENKLHFYKSAGFEERNRKLPKGEEQHLSKLTNDQVIEIRRLWVSGEVTNKTSLGRMFGVKEGAIRLILSNQTWKHLLPVAA